MFKVRMLSNSNFVTSLLIYLLSYTVSKSWPIIGQIRGCFTLTPSLAVIAANIRITFTSPETRMIFLPDQKTARSHLHSSGKTLECDGPTYRQNSPGYQLLQHFSIRSPPSDLIKSDRRSDANTILYKSSSHIGFESTSGSRQFCTHMQV